MERKKVFFLGKFHVGFPQRRSHFGDVSCIMVLWFQILTRKEKSSEVVIDLCKCSGLALTTQNKAASWEKECGLSRDKPAFHLGVTIYMCIFSGQARFGRLFLCDQQKTDRKAGSSESCFMIIVTKETNSLVFMCSADGCSESLRLRRYHRIAWGRRRDENSQSIWKLFKTMLLI